MYIGLHVKCPLFLSDFNKLEFSRLVFKKYSDIKFNKDLSSGSRVFSCRRLGRQTDLTKLIVAFRNVVKASKNPKKQLFTYDKSGPVTFIVFGRIEACSERCRWVPTNINEEVTTMFSDKY
jgi:hypothetical protein